MNNNILKSKQVYLTIDDAPSKDFKKKVDYLYKRNIKAIFFCIGQNMERYKEDVVYAINKGFIIGNHSYEHKHFSDLSMEEGKESIKKTDKIINEIYKMSGKERPIKVFRFPYLDQGGDNSGEDYESKWARPKREWSLFPRKERRMALQYFLKELGYTHPLFKGIKQEFLINEKIMDDIDVNCTFDQMEYYLGVKNAPYGMEKEEAILARIDEDVPFGGRALNYLDSSDIIMIHDHENTTDLFYKIIDKYIEKNFEFRDISE